MPFWQSFSCLIMQINWLANKCTIRVWSGFSSTPFKQEAELTLGILKCLQPPKKPPKNLPLFFQTSTANLACYSIYPFSQNYKSIAISFSFIYMIYSFSRSPMKGVRQFKSARSIVRTLCLDVQICQEHFRIRDHNRVSKGLLI